MKENKKENKENTVKTENVSPKEKKDRKLSDEEMDQVSGGRKGGMSIW